MQTDHSFARTGPFQATAILRALLVLICAGAAYADEPLKLDGRLELFVDDYLIDSMSDGVRLEMQKPEPREVVLVTDEPWEGNTSAYYTILQDGDVYRMYYRGSHAVNMKSAHEEVTCYAESADGRRWNKPRLGLFDWEGSKENNIVWRGIGTHCFTPFLDTNPDCPPESRFKALSRGRPVGKKGLYAFESPDGIHWSLIGDAPVITSGAFDSQNLAFWDPEAEQYVAYSRLFTNGVRAIQRSTSSDFTTWSAPTLVTYPGSPNQHLYTNAIRPCPGAPHLRIGFPTRYLPDTQQVEPVFMSSRDGLVFHRFDEPAIPQSAPQDRDGNRSNYMANGLLQLPDFPNEWSVYGTEAYYEGPDSRLRRFVYRKNGLVAIRGTGTVVSKLLQVTSDSIILNYQHSKSGSLSVDICNSEGERIADTINATNDRSRESERTFPIRWQDDRHLQDHEARVVQLRIKLNDARLYALQFRE